MSRERALNQIVTLKVLANDPRAPEAERQAAKDTMSRLRKKYNIPETTKLPPPRASRPSTSEPGSYRWFEDMVRNWDNNPETQRKKREKAARDAANSEAQRIKRERAQRDWEARMADKDDQGVPLTAEEAEWARRDPLGFAAARDKRSHQQKQNDMQDAFGQPHQRPRCNPKMPFFDLGGEPRTRNSASATCEKCNHWLARGEGALYLRGYACCDTVPGPRAKKSDSEER